MSNPYGGVPNGFNQQAYPFYQQTVQQFQQPQPQSMMMAPVTPPVQPRFDPRSYNQPMIQQNHPAGRVIDNPAEIQPIEVPMTGELVFFPMRDGSAVICKCWRSDGNLVTMRYIPEQVEQAAQDQTQQGPTFAERIEEIYGMLKKLTE